MNNRFQAKVFIGFLLVFFFLVPSLFSAEKRVVKVVVENAGIRVKPDMESEILEFPPMGRLFEVEEKTEGWYKIRFTSQVGTPIAGNIHVCALFQRRSLLFHGTDAREHHDRPIRHLVVQ